MLLSVEHGVRYLFQLIFQVFLKDNSLQKILLGPSHLCVEHLLHIGVWQSDKVCRVQLRRLSYKRWLSQPSQKTCCYHGYNESGHMERAETYEQKVASLCQEFRVHQHRLSTLASHVKSGDDILPLGLTTVFLSLVEEVSNKVTICCRHIFLSCELSLELLIFHLCLHLILGILESKFRLRFILNSLSTLLFLSCYTLLITVPSHLAHLLLLLKSFLISLELKLNLILGSPLSHLGFVLSGLTLLLLLNLCPLNLQLLGIFGNLELLGCLFLDSEVESILCIWTGVQVFGSLYLSKEDGHLRQLHAQALKGRSHSTRSVSLSSPF